MRRKKHENKQKSIPQYEIYLWEAIEVNNDLKFNVDKQQDDIKHLKEQCDKDDKDEFRKSQPIENPWKRKKACYVTCNQTLAMKNY